MTAAQLWDTIGRVTVLTCAWLVVTTVLAIVELYWPGVYRFLVNVVLMAVLVFWLFFWRRS